MPQHHLEPQRLGLSGNAAGTPASGRAGAYGAGCGGGDLRRGKTQSGTKSRSSKGGTPANFNEIRMEDKKGAEQLFIHAEKGRGGGNAAARSVWPERSGGGMSRTRTYVDKLLGDTE